MKGLLLKLLITFSILLVFFYLGLHVGVYLKIHNRHQGRFLGKSKSEVEQILGKPSLTWMDTTRNAEVWAYEPCGVEFSGYKRERLDPLISFAVVYYKLDESSLKEFYKTASPTKRTVTDIKFR
jgi:hypothetical protein